MTCQPKIFSRNGKQKGGGSLRRLLQANNIARLAPQTNADGGEGAVKTDILCAANIDAAIHRAEEKVGLVTKTDFDVGISDGEASKGSDVGYNDASRARVIRCSRALVGNW